jgi:hypothetical protein
LEATVPEPAAELSLRKPIAVYSLASPQNLFFSVMSSAEPSRAAFERKPIQREDGRLLIETRCTCGFVAIASAYDNTLAIAEQSHIENGCRPTAKLRYNP